MVETLISQAVKHQNRGSLERLSQHGYKVAPVGSLYFSRGPSLQYIYQNSNFLFLSSFDSRYAFVLVLRF